MTTKTKNETTEEAPKRTRAEIERELAALDAESEALRQDEAARAQAAQTKANQEEAEFVRIGELANVMGWGAAPWNLIHELAGDEAEDPRFILGLVCYLAARPTNGGGNILRDNLTLYIEAWKRGMNPGNPSPLDAPAFRELQIKHVEREQAAQAARRANR